MTDGKEFNIFISYSQLVIFDHALPNPFNEWTDRHVSQGFSWRHGSAAFRTVEESGRHIVTLRCESQAGHPSPGAIRIIDVPFEVPINGKIELGSISDSALIDLPPGIYQLRYECYGHAGGEIPRIDLRLHMDEAPHFGIVRADDNINPSSDLLLEALPA